MDVRQRIKKMIKDSGIKQYVIAQKAGFNPKEFSAMLTGRKKITIEDFITICKALNVSANDIINPKEEKNKAS